MGLELVSIIVRDYDEAIAFFVDVLGFYVAEDSASFDGDAEPKRWVVVKSSGSSSGILLAQARGELQEGLIGRQFGDRVGLFLRVDDFDEAYARMTGCGVEFLTVPREEPYGSVAVFKDLYGNKWDLLGPSKG